MFGIRTRALTGLTLLAAAYGIPTKAEAQLFPRINPCGTCYQQAAIPIMQPQYVSVAPMIQTVQVENPCMRPVTETVYQDVQKVDYIPVQKQRKVAQVVTEMIDQPVTTYQTVYEPQTQNVTSYVNQQVTEMRPVTLNQSYWQTTCQAVPKYSPCEYDSRAGLIPELNRRAYAMRSAMTPNVVARREFVPNIVQAQVPVNRTVQVPVTQQVTYNVAKQVAVQTTQKVAVNKTVWVDETYTAYEPQYTTQKVAVGTQTRMVYVGPESTSTALTPTPTTTAQDSKEAIKAMSASPGEMPIKNPTYQREPQPTPAAPVQAVPAVKESEVVSSEVEAATRVAGWKAARRSNATPINLEGPELTVAQK